MGDGIVNFINTVPARHITSCNGTAYTTPSGFGVVEYAYWL